MAHRKKDKYEDVDHRQRAAVENFSGAMLAQLRLQPDFFQWDPSLDEMILSMSKTFAQMKKAAELKDRRAVQVAAADLGNLSLKCFNHYGK